MGALQHPFILLLVLFLALVLFGGGKVAKMGGELGAAIREFKKGLNDEQSNKDAEKKEIPEQTQNKI